MSVWNLEDSLKLIRSLQPETRRFNYHLCLGGGVLNKGESNKDLDLVFVPMDNGKSSDPNGLLAYLKTLWGESFDFNIPDESITRVSVPVQAPAEPYSSDPFSDTVYRHKLKFYFDGTDRIDVFIMNPATEHDSTVEQEPTVSIDLETPTPITLGGVPGNPIRLQDIPYQTSRWDGLMGQSPIPQGPRRVEQNPNWVPPNRLEELRQYYGGTWGDVTRSTEPAWRTGEEQRRLAREERLRQEVNRRYTYIGEQAPAPSDSELDDLLDDDYDDVDE